MLSQRYGRTGNNGFTVNHGRLQSDRGLTIFNRGVTTGKELFCACFENNSYCRNVIVQTCEGMKEQPHFPTATQCQIPSVRAHRPTGSEFIYVLDIAEF